METTVTGPSPVGQAGVAQRLGLVDPAPERREDALDRVPELALAGEADVRRLEAPAALDPRRRGAAHEHLVDLRVGEQRLERPEPERALGDPGDERVARPLVEHRRLAVHERADPRLRVIEGCRVGRLREHALAQRRREAVEGGGVVGLGGHAGAVGRGARGSLRSRPPHALRVG